MAQSRVTRWMRTSAWADRLLAVIALSPVCILVVRQVRELGNRVVPCCDFAALELGTRAFLRGEQLLGLYSREGWRHPGPAPFLWSSIFRPLPGESFAEHQVAAAVLGLLALTTLLVASWHRVSSAGWSLVVVLVSVFVVRFGVDSMRMPWNPSTSMMWVLIAVVCTAAYMQTRSSLSVGIAVAAGSMAAQSHVGAAPTIAICFTVIAVTIVRSRHRRECIKNAWIAGGILALLWFMPIADLLFGNRNAWKIVTSSSGSSEAIDRSELLLSAMWVSGNSPGTIGDTFGPASPFVDMRAVIWLDIVAAVVVGVLTLIALVRWRRDRFTGSLAALALSSLALTVAALLGSDGPFLRYLMLPIAGLGMLLWIAGGVSSIHILQRHEHNVLKVLAWPVVIALSTVSILGMETQKFTDDFDNPDVDIIVERVRADCDRFPDRSIIEVDSEVEWFDALAVIVPIERCATVRILGHIGFLAGQPYQADETATANVFITSGDVPGDATAVARSETIAVAVSSR